MEKVTIEKLEWDSDFFGYEVGKIDLSKIEKIDEEHLKNEILSSKFKLLYLFASPEQKEIEKAIKETGAILVDQKITFSKATEKHNLFSHKIREYKSKTISEELKKLAVLSGCSSRFRNDPNFSNNEFEKLYTTWIERSVNKEIATKVIVATHEKTITGLITLAAKGNIATIGLLAVDENYQKMKIGSELIRKADTEAFSTGCLRLSVATQFQNVAAMKLYQQSGFTVDLKMNVFHYWNNK